MPSSQSPAHADVAHLAIKPFSADELAAFRRLGDREDNFDDLARTALRLQVLRTFRGARLSGAVEEGAAKAEDAALARLACCPSPDEERLALKADLFSSRLAGGDNFAAMLKAALGVDATRLGAARERAYGQAIAVASSHRRTRKPSLGLS